MLPSTPHHGRKQRPCPSVTEIKCRGLSTHDRHGSTRQHAHRAQTPLALPPLSNPVLRLLRAINPSRLCWFRLLIYIPNHVVRRCIQACRARQLPHARQRRQRPCIQIENFGTHGTSSGNHVCHRLFTVSRRSHPTALAFSPPLLGHCPHPHPRLRLRLRRHQPFHHRCQNRCSCGLHQTPPLLLILILCGSPHRRSRHPHRHFHELRLLHHRWMLDPRPGELQQELPQTSKAAISAVICNEPCII
jgi:hypothetical protein